MYLPLNIAKRYLFSKKKTNAINIISGISILGMTVGTMALIIVLSVFNGFESLVISLHNAFNPDIEISSKLGKTFVADSSLISKIESVEGVKYVSQVLEENALLKYNDKQYIATVKGVDDNFEYVSNVDSVIIRGEYALKKKEQPFAVLGIGVEGALFADIDNPFYSIKVYVPKRGNKTVLDPSKAFNIKEITPGGSFSIQQDFDNKYMIVPLRWIRELLNYKNEVSAIEISASSSNTQAALINLLGDDFEVKNRFEQNEFLYKILKTEKLGAYLILTFILIIAAFNMIGSISMLVIEKKKDIFTLKAIGSSNALIKQIFLTHGLLMSFLGCGIGLALGLLICWAQIEFGILKLEGLFVVDAFPVKILIEDFFLILITVVTIGIIAAWIPSRKAAIEA